jgi:cytidylate kinase
MIVTIDGPAGAGKSSVAKALAQRLGFRTLDTGAMYRAVALAGLRRGIDWGNPAALAELAREVRIELLEDEIYLDGVDVSLAIRADEVTSMTHYAANNAAVRQHLVQLQRAAVNDQDFVSEGRDQGTVVFPHAQCKIFLTASPEERARRRHEELKARGENLSLEDVLARQNERDERDAAREVGPLIAAEDAVEFCTDRLTSEEVVEQLEQIVRSKCRQP